MSFVTPACVPLLRRVVLLLGACLALAACNAAAPPPATRPPVEPALYSSLAAAGATIDAEGARQMISLYRGNRGLAPLELDDSLQSVAQRQAQDMARRGDLSARGALGARLREAGLTRKAAIENVSAGYHTLAEAFSGWRDSAPHNARMLDERVKRMGIATAYAPAAKYKVYWALVLTD